MDSPVARDTDGTAAVNATHVVRWQIRYAGSFGMESDWDGKQCYPLRRIPRDGKLTSLTMASSRKDLTENSSDKSVNSTEKK